MEPDSNVKLTIPEGSDINEVYKEYPTKQVPLIGDRWKNGESFGDFESKTFEAYYKQNS